MHRIQVRAVEVPERDPGQSGQRYGVSRSVSGRLAAHVDRRLNRRGGGFTGLRGRPTFRHRQAASCNHRFTVAQLRLQNQRTAHGSGQKTIHIQRGRGSQHVARTSKDIVNPGVGHNAQRNLAIDAAKGHVIDLVAERRNIRALSGVKLHAQHVVAIEMQMLSQLEGERCVSSLVFAQARAVDPNRGGGHGALEIDEDPLSACAGRQSKAASPGGDELVILVVEAMPGKTRIAVRQHHAAEMRVVEFRRCGGVDLARGIPPVAIHRENLPARHCGMTRGCLFRDTLLCMQGRCGQQPPGRLKKPASIHDPIPETSVFHLL